MPKSISRYFNPLRWFAPFRAEDTKSEARSSLIPSTAGGVLNEKRRKKKKDKEMEMAVYEEVPPFIPVIKEGKIVRVCDGNTVTVATRILIEGKPTMSLYRFNIRLRGIDASLTESAQRALQDFVFGKIVKMQGINYDKHGRLCGDINTLDQINVGQWMIDNGQAISLSGNGKYVPNEWVDIPLTYEDKSSPVNVASHMRL